MKCQDNQDLIENVMAKIKRSDAALGRHCEDIVLVPAGESKWLLVVLTNWCKEKSISQVNSCIPNTRSSDGFLY